MKYIINAISYYMPQIILIIIVFLPYEVEIRGLILFSIWTAYCTLYLIKSKIMASKRSNKYTANSTLKAKKG